MSEVNPILKLESVSHGYVQAGRRIDVLADVNLELSRPDHGPGWPVWGRQDHFTEFGRAAGTARLWPDMGGGHKGQQLIRKKRTQLRRRHIGMVFQFHRLFPEFNATENIMIPQMLNGLAKAEAEKTQLLLGMVGLSDRATHRPGLLSGGEQQRVAIARAVANAPDILLADEPTGNLDPETGEVVFQALQKIVHGTQTAALIVTHNQKLAAMMDEVLELEHGHIVQKVRP